MLRMTMYRFQAGDMVGAVETYTTALSLPLVSHRHPVILTNRSAAFASMGRWKEALSDCNVALALWPLFSRAATRRATCLFNLNRLEEARDQYVLLIEENPFDDSLQKSLHEVEMSIRKAEMEQLGARALELCQSGKVHTITKHEEWSGVLVAAWNRLIIVAA